MEEFLAQMTATTSMGALVLAMTRRLIDEDKVKASLQGRGYQFAVTEIGGNTSYVEFQEKTTRSVIGACLHCGMISKTEREIHAVLHAAEEAKRGIVVNVSTSTHVSLKIAIVRKGSWISVAMFGESAVHHLTNHQRAGLGIMHI